MASVWMGGFREWWERPSRLLPDQPDMKTLAPFGAQFLEHLLSVEVKGCSERLRLQSSGPSRGTWVPARVTKCSVSLEFLGGGTPVLNQEEKLVTPLQPQLCPYMMTWLYDPEHQRLQLLRSPEMGPGEG